MRQLIKYLCLALMLVSLTACVANGGRKELQDSHKIIPAYESGSIFKSGINERPLYEVKRPRNVGDGLMMMVAEMPVSDKKFAGKDKGDDATKSDRDKSRDKDKSSEININDGEDKAGFANIDSTLLSGSINMTVVEVHDNGNLRVTGGRLVNIDEEDRRYLRITGVVDPRNITDSMISSTQVAEARILIENVRGDGRTSRSSDGSNAFGNFFQSVFAR